jgi:hypothetical protein
MVRYALYNSKTKVTELTFFNIKDAFTSFGGLHTALLLSFSILFSKCFDQQLRNFLNAKTSGDFTEMSKNLEINNVH